MAYPTYRQDFEGGSTLATACPELTDSSTSPPGWSIDTTSKGVTGANSLLAPIRTAISLLVSSASDTLSGNVSVSAYVRSMNAGTVSPIKEYRIYGRATSTALSTGYFADLATAGLFLIGQTAGSTTFGPVGGGAVNAIVMPNNVPVLVQLWLSGTAPVAVKACIVRQDTGQFWSNAASGWTATPTYVSGTDSTGGINAGAGLIGLYHQTTNLGGPTETANYTDDLIYEPATQKIDIPTVTLTSASPTQQLTAGGFTDPLAGVTWSSSNPAAVLVSSTGLVSSVAVGSATITATGRRDPSQTATSTVTVSSIPIFAYRIPVTIDNTANATSALSYYQVSITLTGAAYTSINAHAKADRSDLRVFHSDGVTPINFALEGNDTVNSVIYLLVKVPRVPAASTRTIYVYYGNASAGSVSSYAGTVGPNTAIVGPTDIISQTDVAGYNDGSWMVLFKNQDKANGGGASLNGRIYLISNTGQVGNPSTGGSITACVSTDGGVTWGTKINLATADATHGFSAQTITELADGTLLMYYCYDLGTNYAGGKENQYVARSTDGGATWTNLSTSPTNRIVGPWTAGTDTALGYGQFIERTAGGDLFKTVYGRIIATDTGGRSWMMKCPASSDPTNGNNWTLQGIIAYDNVHKWSETGFLQTSDASHYIAIMRDDTAGATGDLWITSSADSGVTWGTPALMGIPVNSSQPNIAVSPFLMRLASGNILLLFGIRFPATNALWGVGALLSTDGGATFVDRAISIPMGYTTVGVAASGYGDFGYPNAVQNADGTIVISGYHEVGGVNTTTNVARAIVTEDWLVNSVNLYSGCESFTVDWASHQANCTISSTQKHSGTNSIKIDNSAATGGLGVQMVWDPWVLNPGKLAISYWKYITQITTATAQELMRDASNANRIQESIQGTPYHLFYWNGASWQDTGTAITLNQWVKQTTRATVNPTSVTGQILVNNASITTSLAQAASGAPVSNVLFYWGSIGANSNTTGYLDDLYTHQYTANIPVITAGSEQVPPVVTGTAAALLIGF